MTAIRQAIRHLTGRTAAIKPPPLVPHPLTVVLFITLLISGISVVVGGKPTPALAQLPLWLYLSYGVFLTVGSALCVLGQLHRDWRVGLKVEQLGLPPLLFALGMYTVAAVAAGGGITIARALPVAIVIGFIIGGAYRLCQVSRFIRSQHNNGGSGGS